jgi:hypothetical protein
LSWPLSATKNDADGRQRWKRPAILSLGAASILAGVMCVADAAAFSSPGANHSARAGIRASSSDDTFATTPSSPSTSFSAPTTPSTSPALTTPSTTPATEPPTTSAAGSAPASSYGSASDAVGASGAGKRKLRRLRRESLVGVDSGSLETVAKGIITEIDNLSGRAYSIPANADNIALFEAWMVNEGGLWANNPLNTSLDGSRYPHQFNGNDDTGIPIYPTIAIGVAETAKTLVDFPAYAHILAVLSTGHASCTAFGTAVIDSPWASSHYGYDPSRFCQT